MSELQRRPALDPDGAHGQPDLAKEPELVDDPQEGAEPDERPMVDPAGEQILPEELSEHPDAAGGAGVHDRGGDRPETS